MSAASRSSERVTVASGCSSSARRACALDFRSRRGLVATWADRELSSRVCVHAFFASQPLIPRTAANAVIRIKNEGYSGRPVKVETNYR
jgi:hypothetical protein